MKHVLERLNRPQLRRDMVEDWYKAIILCALIVCALYAGVWK